LLLAPVVLLDGGRLSVFLDSETLEDKLRVMCVAGGARENQFDKLQIDTDSNSLAEGRMLVLGRSRLPISFPVLSNRDS
jgi:hypothetical protein